MPKAAVTRINGAFQVQSTYVGDPSNPTNINGFLLPQLTTTQAQTQVAALSPAVLQNGFIYYDTTLNGIMAYVNGGWVELYTDPNAGFFILPNGTSAAVEVAGNQTEGFMYYNTTATNVRGYFHGAWTTVVTNTNAATGIGLTAGNTPDVLPTGASASVEAVGNQVAGFVYYNSTATNIRAYANAAWSTVQTSTNAATGAGLTAGNTPVVLPSGASASVEVAGNQVEGFIYYNTTATNIRAYVNGAWATIT